MQYGYTIIYVSSVEETLEFYKKAFGFDIKFIHESKAYAVLLKMNIASFDGNDFIRSKTGCSHKAEYGKIPAFSAIGSMF